LDEALGLITVGCLSAPEVGINLGCASDHLMIVLLTHPTAFIS
jgi:hypothetical protein